MSQVRRQTAMLPRPNWGWQDAAACRGEDLMLFFGPDGERQPERDVRERKAKQVCASCHAHRRRSHRAGAGVLRPTLTCPCWPPSRTFVHFVQSRARTPHA